MDTNSLVKEGSLLVTLLDQTAIRPIAAMWVHNVEQDSWQLWIVPADAGIGKFEFFRCLAEVISTSKTDLPNLDISDVRFRNASDKAIQALNSLVSLNGLGSVHLSSNRMNGFYLPDGIVLRMAA